jgi:hypothetical protein
MSTQLITVGTLKTYLGVPATDTTEDGFLDALCTRISAAAIRLIGKNILRAPYTQYLSGNGQKLLPLRERPLWAYVATGTTINGQPTITGLPSTGLFLAGMSVAPTNANNANSNALFPPQTFITAINSSSQVTLNNNASVSGPQTLIFGLDVYEDEAGFTGSVANSYQSTTQLIYGTHYSLYNPQPTAVLGSQGVVPLCALNGMLYRIIGQWWRAWTISGGLAPYFGAGTGNILVNYTAGYSAVPPDLELGCMMAAARARASRPLGVPLSAEGYEEYHYSAEIPEENGLGFFSGPAAALILPYRNLPV